MLARHKECFMDKGYVPSLVLSLFLLAAGLAISSYAVGYANESASNPVTDVVLSNFQVRDIDGFFVNGAVLMVLFIVGVCLWFPKRIPFVVKTIAIFVVVRSLFIIVTHIGAFPTQAPIDPESQGFLEDIIGTKLYSSFFLGNDSFLSGHTGLPFLMAFLYWDKLWLRIAFIALSIAFGVVVLLGHIHYTIDVLSAFFISYGIYRMSRRLFKEDLSREALGLAD